MPSIPPAGYSPASAFELTRNEATLPPVPILADQIDPQTGEYLSLEDSATIADGLVVTLLRTTRDSGAAVLGVGQRFRDIRNVNDDSGTLTESIARQALQPAIEAGVIALRAVSASVNASDGTQIDTGIEYLDLLAPPEANGRQLSFTP
jgi:hypothetical protein